MMQKNEAWRASTMASLHNDNSNGKPTGPHRQVRVAWMTHDYLPHVKRDGLMRREKGPSEQPAPELRATWLLYFPPAFTVQLLGHCHPNQEKWDDFLVK